MIPLFKVHMPKNTGQRVQDVLYSGYIAEGEHVRNFEKYLQKFLKCDNIITTNSCTSALHLALKLFDTGDPNDYVLTTPMTCIASNVSITNLGATPIWVDVDPKHGMITAKTLRKAYNECRFKGVDFRISALIYVCWGGDIGPLKEVSKVCRELDIPLIVDAAQAFGKVPPNVADIVCYSFQAIKHITTGDGGAMQFKDSDLMARAFNLKWFGINREGFRTSTGEINWESDVPEIGFKFHMNNIAGTIGCAQMEDKTLTNRLKRYQENDQLLTRELDGFKDITRSWLGVSSSWVATFLCDNPIGLLVHLQKCGVHVSQMHVNNDVYTGFRGFKLVNLSGTNKFMKTHICFPCGWWVTKENIKHIIKSVKSYYE